MGAYHCGFERAKGVFAFPIRKMVFTPVHPVSVSITRAIERASIFTLDNTAAKSGPCISNQAKPGSYDRDVFLVFPEFESFSKAVTRLSYFHRLCPRRDSWCRRSDSGHLPSRISTGSRQRSAGAADSEVQDCKRFP